MLVHGVLEMTVYSNSGPFTEDLSIFNLSPGMQSIHQLKAVYNPLTTDSKARPFCNYTFFFETDKTMQLLAD